MSRWYALSLALALCGQSGFAAASDKIDLRKVYASPTGVWTRGPSKKRVELTLDRRWQAKAAALLRRSRAPAGAIVVANAKSGEILAWASRGSAQDLGSAPFYPGASVMKVATAAELLERKRVYRGTKVCHAGGERRLSASDVEVRCRPGEVQSRFDRALAKSINVVFGRLAAHDLSSVELRDAAKRLVPGSDFDLSVAPSWMRPLDSKISRARTGAGFENNRLSPLSAVWLMHTIANRGRAPQLRALLRTAPARGHRTMTESTANALRRMLAGVTRYGTARTAFAKLNRAHYRVAGKTGTLAVRGRLVSWFAGYGPYDDPDVVVAVMLANRPRWWRKAPDVAAEVFAYASTAHAAASGKVRRRAVSKPEAKAAPPSKGKRPARRR